MRAWRQRSLLALPLLLFGGMRFGTPKNPSEFPTTRPVDDPLQIHADRFSGHTGEVDPDIICGIRVWWRERASEAAPRAANLTSAP